MEIVICYYKSLNISGMKHISFITGTKKKCGWDPQLWDSIPALQVHVHVERSMDDIPKTDLTKHYSSNSMCSVLSACICDPSRQKGHVVGKHCFEI